MSDQLRPGNKAASPSRLQRVDELCDRFEDAWKARQRPRIEDYLGDGTEPERRLLLGDLLRLELFYRRQSYETVSLEEYQRRFPEHGDLIQVVFGEELAGEPPEPASSPQSYSREPELVGAAEQTRPACLGRHRITGTLGQGGFGVVYKGYDDQLNRPVAIKVPHRHRVSQPHDAAAYLDEARILARLDHPNIVPVYDVGSTDDGLCYVVSKFIEEEFE